MTLRRILAVAVLCAFPVIAGSIEAQPVVAIIGTGDMGDSLGPRFVELGYEVIFGSREPDGEKAQAVVRGFMMSHNVHHRGQLSVYLRLCEVPVPQTYGPSADETDM